MKVAEPMQVAMPCGIKLEIPAGYFAQLDANQDLKNALAKASGKDPTGPIIDMIIALLPQLLPILLPLLIGSITPKNDDPPAP
jgi:hypothetical protein